MPRSCDFNISSLNFYFFVNYVLLCALQTCDLQPIFVKHKIKQKYLIIFLLNQQKMVEIDVHLSVRKCDVFFKKNYNLKIPEDWLNQCVEFAIEEDPVRNYFQDFLLE